MSAGILTDAGRDLFAAKQGAGQVLIIDRFMLANIVGLDPNTPANPLEALPAPGDQVATLPVTQSGYVSADKVVYSLYMGTTVGDFTFNWVGLLADDDTLVAVRYIDPVAKYATAGQDLGNAITRNFLITYTDAQAITNVTVEAASWQWQFDDATTEQKGLVELATQTEMNAETDPARVPAVNVVASYVAAKIAALVDSSPGALDTLNELAAALGDDPNFATTITTALAQKLSKSAGDTLLGQIYTHTNSAPGGTQWRIVNTGDGDVVLYLDGSDGDLAGGDYASIRHRHSDNTLVIECGAAGGGVDLVDGGNGFTHNGQAVWTNDIVSWLSAANGYLELPNGWILQAVSVAAGANSGIWPTAFPNACIFAAGGQVTEQTSDYFFANVYASNLTGFSAQVYGGLPGSAPSTKSQPYKVFALGF